MRMLTKACLLAVAALLLSSCSFAPLSPRVDAASIGKHNVKLESNVAPTASFGAIYGVTDDLDIALEVEQLGLGSVWSRYSFINNPEGFSLAGNAGVFYGAGSNNESNGWYAGIVASEQVTPTIRWSASYRHALLDYQYGIGEDNGWFSVLDFDNPDDASVNGQLSLSMSFLLKPHVEVAVGGVCQFLWKNQDPNNKSNVCLPTIGFSFYRL